MQGFDVDERCGHKNLSDRAAVAVADQLIDSRALRAYLAERHRIHRRTSLRQECSVPQTRRTLQAAKTLKEHGTRQVMGLDFGRRAVGICATAPTLSGCGAAQLPMSTAPQRVIVELRAYSALGSGDVVNAIGTKKKLWKSSVIVVLWNDWGGWYGNVAPPSLSFCVALR
jgi:hypothetical protein